MIFTRQQLCRPFFLTCMVFMFLRPFYFPNISFLRLFPLLCIFLFTSFSFITLLTISLSLTSLIHSSHSPTLTVIFIFFSRIFIFTNSCTVCIFFFLFQFAVFLSYCSLSLFFLYLFFPSLSSFLMLSILSVLYFIFFFYSHCSFLSFLISSFDFFCLSSKSFWQHFSQTLTIEEVSFLYPSY